MARVEELFGSGDLLGVELSIDALTGEIVVYSDELTLDQKQRIEEAIGEVTYLGGSGDREPPLELSDETLSEFAKERVESIDISEDHRTVTLIFLGMRPLDPANQCSADYEGWTHVNGDVLEVAAVRTVPRYEPLCFPSAFTNWRGLTVTLDEPFNGTEVRDIESGFVLVLEPLA